MRDAYVHKATDLATKAIKSDEIRAYDGKPGQVSYYDSTGAFFIHTERGEFTRDGRTIDPVTARLITDGVWTHG
jgi:hypothetical protein